VGLSSFAKAFKYSQMKPKHTMYGSVDAHKFKPIWAPHIAQRQMAQSLVIWPLHGNTNAFANACYWCGPSGYVMHMKSRRILTAVHDDSVSPGAIQIGLLARTAAGLQLGQSEVFEPASTRTIEAAQRISVHIRRRGSLGTTIGALCIPGSELIRRALKGHVLMPFGSYALRAESDSTSAFYEASIVRHEPVELSHFWLMGPTQLDVSYGPICLDTCETISENEPQQDYETNDEQQSCP
jgi:hypothetical protein